MAVEIFDVRIVHKYEILQKSLQITGQIELFLKIRGSHCRSHVFDPYQIDGIDVQQLIEILFEVAG
jgi:hypothetical protein